MRFMKMYTGLVGGCEGEDHRGASAVAVTSKGGVGKF